MKQNYETCIVGSSCVLVPYRRVHVDRYHKWMQSPALLEATGSEPLSLEEEYAMQEGWRIDGKKCTFIILKCDNLPIDIPLDGERNDEFVKENVQAMVGDVNLFLSEEDDDEEEEERQENGKEEQALEKVEKPARIQAELDIMVAEESARGLGIGLEASCLMMLYGARQLGIRRFFCKINEDNQSSLALFRKLKFVQCDYAACFKQYEYELKRPTPADIMDHVAPFVRNTGLRTFTCISDVIEQESIWRASINPQFYCGFLLVPYYYVYRFENSANVVRMTACNGWWFSAILHNKSHSI